MENKNKIVLGIDPGTNITGYGIVEKQGQNIGLINHGIIDLTKQKDHYSKIKMLYEQVTKLIKLYSPTELAIESPFYGKNIQSMLKLGRAQGAAIIASLNFDMEINEYAPRKIKMAITGNGNASKEQVAIILKSIVNKQLLNQHDATDAVAVAVCHCYQNKISNGNKNYSNWKDYINKNPKKVKN